MIVRRGDFREDGRGGDPVEGVFDGNFLRCQPRRIYRRQKKRSCLGQGGLLEIAFAGHGLWQFPVSNTNASSNITCEGKKAFGPGAMGLYLEGHPRQPLRLLIPTVWARDDFHVPTLPVPQSSLPSQQSKCNIDKGVCISSAGRRTSGCRTGSYPSTPAKYLPAPAAPPPVGALPTGLDGRNPNR